MRMLLAVSRSVVLLLICLGLASCAMFRQQLPPLPPQQKDRQVSYRLLPGDSVRVDVFEVPALSGQFRLDETGQIALPLIAPVPAAGLTSERLATLLAQRIGARYVKNPNVTVRIVEYRGIFVLGQVSKPGSYPYTIGMSVTNAVAVAGGYSYRADQTNIVVTRFGRHYRANPDSDVEPGDTIAIGERFF